MNNIDDVLMQDTAVPVEVQQFVPVEPIITYEMIGTGIMWFLVLAMLFICYDLTKTWYPVLKQKYLT